jgi:hypothetical protein
MVTSYLKWIIRGVMCITMTSINNNERSTALLLLYVEFCTQISSEAALLELKVETSSTQREGGTGGNEGEDGNIITLEQIELADGEAEVQQRGCYMYRQRSKSASLHDHDTGLYFMRLI